MRKLSLALIGLYSGILSAFSQSSTDSSAYKSRKLRPSEINFVTGYIQKCFVSFLFLLLFFYNSRAQPIKNFSSKSYGVNEGLLSRLVLDMVEDGNGFLWISTGAGLQRFDGNNFETISAQEGLPQTSNLSFFKLNNGNLWLRYEDGISTYNSVTNKFRLLFGTSKKYQNSSQLIQISSHAYPFVVPFVPFAEIKDEVWCWDELQKKFIAINEFSGKITDSLIVPYILQPTSYRYKKGNDSTVFFEAAHGDIVQINFITKQIKYIYRFNPNSIIKNYTQINYIPISNKELILTTDRAIYKINIVTGASILLCHYPILFSAHVFTTSLTHLHDSLFALSLNKDLFILNAVNGKISYLMADDQNNPFVKTDINKCIIDQYSHLWVISDRDGIKKINFNNLSIKYWGIGKLQENFNRCIYPDKKSNLIITGSLFNGFAVFDTSQNLLKHFKLKFGEQTSCILKIQPYKYLLFTDGDPGVYLLNGKNLQLTILNKKFTKSFIPHEVTHFTYVQSFTDTTAALFCSHSLYIIHYSTTNIEFTRIPLQEDYSGAFINHKKQLWLTDAGKYFILTGEKFERVNIFYLPEKIITKCIVEDNKKNIWIGTEKGLYKLNGETKAIIRIYREKDGLANDSIYSVINDNKGNLWCGTNKGISCIYTNDKIINLYESDGLQSEEFNTNSCAKAPDGELFFGGINGVNSFYPESMKDLAPEPKILMTNIKVMDTNLVSTTASWNLQQITLSYTQNVLSFYFAALSRFSSDVYNYEYKMNGIDKEWINGGNHGYARYVLPPGKYVFEYTGTGNKLEKNLHYKYISISITPPFWRTIWFIILIALCAIVIVIAVVKFYYKRIHKKKLHQIEIQQTLQHERERISRDLHDNIGAYTTVLMASTEQLKQQTDEPVLQQSAQTVSDNAQNIIASLKETIWVLNNDAITFTDFIDRFKLYAKKMIQNYPDVQIKFKEKFDTDFVLSPAEALHLFRIMQEALQNALKHAKPENISISAEVNKVIRFSIKDNGNGFDTNIINNGNGLNNMKYRAKEAGYLLNIFSSKAGTEIILHKITHLQ